MLARSASERLPRKVFEDSSCSTVVIPLVAVPRWRIVPAALNMLIIVEYIEKGYGECISCICTAFEDDSCGRPSVAVAVKLLSGLAVCAHDPRLRKAQCILRAAFMMQIDLPVHSYAAATDAQHTRAGLARLTDEAANAKSRKISLISHLTTDSSKAKLPACRCERAVPWQQTVRM
jgi:hypothetical protein